MTTTAATADSSIEEEIVKEKNLLLLERKIAIATQGFTDYFINKLRRQSEQNTTIICDYILAMNAEVNPVLANKQNQTQILCYLSEFCNQKAFINMTREDVVSYLDSLRKPEDSDPYHKWIGTYNLRSVYFLRFFKWLYYQSMEPKKRLKPDVLHNVPQLKRKEISTIKPSDLWSAETDDYIFLKYCPSKRDKCYHIVARDSSCRPSEILNLRIRDVHFKTSGINQYAEIVVNGKTGTRNLPLFTAVPYIKDWIDDHPQGRNPNAFLIPSFDRNHKRFGNRMKELSLNGIYGNYKHEFFPKLLEDPKVVPEDKQKIQDLLKKPWNLYILRHSALTQKSTVLKEQVLRQHAGWSSNSKVPQKYIHYLGNESNESLLAAYGIETASNRGNILLPDSMKPRSCPNCSESNIPDCKFCSKCRMVLTYDAYGETLEEQKKKDNLLEQMRQQQLQYQHKIEEFEDRDKKEKEELREGLAETMKMIRILVTDGDDDTRAKNKAYHLQPEDTETNEGIKASSTRAFKQLKEDTLSAAHSSYYKQQRRQQQQRQRRHRMKNN